MSTTGEDIFSANNSINAANQTLLDLQKQIDDLKAYQNSVNTSISIPTIVAAPNTDIYYLYSENSVVNVSASNGGIIFPTGTTEERPVDPRDGTVRFNSNTKALEIFASGWEDVGTGTSGGGGGPMFNGLYFENDSTITTGFTTANGKNYMTVGPILHTSGMIVVENSSWRIV